MYDVNFKNLFYLKMFSKYFFVFMKCDLHGVKYIDLKYYSSEFSCMPR